MIDLDAIRARDRDYDDVFEAQANMSKDIAHRLAAWPVADRRALLAYVDALRAAAGKVTRARCEQIGVDGSLRLRGKGRPDCADLRRILEGLEL
jgi:hypothetical protein